MENQQLSNHNFNIFSNVLCIYFNWTHGQLDTLTNTTLNGQPLVFQFQLQYSSQMYSLSIFIGHMDKQTQNQLLMDYQQLYNSNFNILLKCIVYLFQLDTWTTGHTDEHNFLMDNHQLSNSNFNKLLKCILYLFSLDTGTNRHTNKINF